MASWTIHWKSREACLRTWRMPRLSQKRLPVDLKIPRACFETQAGHNRKLLLIVIHTLPVWATPCTINNSRGQDTNESRPRSQRCCLHEWAAVCRPQPHPPAGSTSRASSKKTGSSRQRPRRRRQRPLPGIRFGCYRKRTAGRV